VNGRAERGEGSERGREGRREGGREGGREGTLTRQKRRFPPRLPLLEKALLTVHLLLSLPGHGPNCLRPASCRVRGRLPEKREAGQADGKEGSREGGEGVLKISTCP
jgi:hypothetical protein